MDPRKVAAHRDCGRVRWFAGLAVLALIRASEAMAADQGAGVALGPAREDSRPPFSITSQPFDTNSELGAWSSSTPHSDILDPAFAASRYGKWDLSLPASSAHEPLSAGATGAASGGEFRPRPRSLLEPDAGTARPGDTLRFDETVWQRLAEYRTRDRVRVLTLWESAASAVSIQTDRKGGPSLQWTSRWMNRGGATRGLLDHWMPASIRGLSHSAAPSPPPVKSPSLMLLAPHPGFNPSP